MAIARPTHRRLFAVFDHAYGRLSRRAGAVLADVGVKPAQATALVYLGYHNGCQLSELAAGVGAGNAAVTGLVDRMVKTGLVERRKLQSDGRGKTVHLTPDGLAKREQVMQRLRTLDEKLSKNFTDAEMEIIYKFLHTASEMET
ncbi:MAG: MarR family transcriptional regulator [Robiginitomaculum sp.]|nr:MarR family transcriptional regulator [Robiginitomaculum sp.]